jgi:hypothetical protein
MQRLLPAALLVLVAAGCGADTSTRATRAPGERTFTFVPVAEITDGTERILARPERVSVLPDGRFVIADLSDKNLKVYSPAGSRVQTVGRVGHGPGEFTALTTGQVYRDSLLGFDMSGSRLSFFGPGGTFARNLLLTPRDGSRVYRVRVVDDSLFLLVGAVPGSAGRDLLTLVRPDGTRVASFFNPASYLGDDAKLIQRTGVVADGAGGVVFAALVGGDSVYAFGYSGRRLGAGPVDPVQPLVTTRTLLQRSNGEERRPDGSYVTDGNRNVVGLVALDSATVALQVSRYDAERGIDLLDGGTMIVATLTPPEGIGPILRRDGPGLLAGRDREGRLLVLRYANADGDAYRLDRLAIGAAAGGVAP